MRGKRIWDEDNKKFFSPEDLDKLNNILTELGYKNETFELTIMKKKGNVFLKSGCNTFGLNDEI